MYYIGIDPGATGGIVALDSQACLYDLAAFDNSNPLVVAKEFISRFEKSIIFIEDVHAMPGNGGVSMFNFGRGYGALIGLIYGMGMGVHLVSPKVWQKCLPYYGDGFSPKQKVQRAIVEAGLESKMKLKRTLHQGVCDAYWIARHAYAVSPSYSDTPVAVEFKKVKRKTAFKI